MRDHPNEYILEHTTIEALTYAEILKHSAALIDREKRDFFDIHPETIDIDGGLFTHPNVVNGFPVVSVTQTGHSIVVSCPCTARKDKMCQHQAQVLLNIIDRPYFRVFFDATLRLAKIRQAAVDFGMEHEPNLETYFQVEYVNKSFVVKPVLKALLSLNAATTANLKEQLLPADPNPLAKKFATPEQQKTILVFSRHKYYDQLEIALLSGDSTRDGKVKNPLSPVDPLERIWETNSIAEAKFYTAVTKFQQHYTPNKADSDLEGLRMVVKNPLQLDVFYHDPKVSEKITASSIVPIRLNALSLDIKLQVFKKEPFFEVSGALCLNDKLYPFHSLKIRYHYFIQIGDTLHLVANTDMLRVLEFFKKNNQLVLIHASKFEAFRQNILAELEHKISIDYAYIKPATKKQFAAQGFEAPQEKIIYLSDQENYVAITLVVRYGNIEIPVFSRKQIYDTDKNGNIFKVARDEALEIQFTALLLLQHPDFEEQLSQGEYFYLPKTKFLDDAWFLDAFEEWRLQNIQIYGFNALKKNQLNANKAKVSVEVNSGIDWFNAALHVRFGKQKATLKQLHKSIRAKSRFVQLDDGTLGILPAEWIKKISQYLEVGEVHDGMIRIPKSNFTVIEQLFEQQLLSPDMRQELASFKTQFNDFEGIKHVPVPAALNATLRDYQQQGLNWLNFLDDFNFGACLADDMGLGKTIQVIAFLLSQRTKRTHNTNLVVVPTSLLFNWQEEVQKFAPSIKLWTNHGPNSVKHHQDFDQYEIILTTYGMLLSDIGFLKDYRFNYIILDESQAIKNPDAQRYKAARLLQSRNKIVLTGTPVENNTFDIYGQLSFACPGLLGNKQYFKEVYAIPIDRFDLNARAIELQQKIKPFILRRTKKAVAKELPEKTEMVIYCEMGEDQRKIYDDHEKALRDYISTKSDDEISKNSMHVLTGLTKLRQICNATTLLKDEEMLSDYSAKIEVLMEQIESKSPDHKILVFSQFVSMLDLIKQALQKRNIGFEYLSGKTKDRATRVHEFQSNSNIRVFLISLKAGGTGLNLTEADYVYLVDPWWNPAVENQAIDRCYRIGQQKNVIAVRLICPNTVEEKIMKLQASKTKLAGELIKTETTMLKSFSKTDLLGMLR
jgi:SNF2 family DNA or RNA helicase